MNESNPQYDFSKLYQQQVAYHPKLVLRQPVRQSVNVSAIEQKFTPESQVPSQSAKTLRNFVAKITGLGDTAAIAASAGIPSATSSPYHPSVSAATPVSVNGRVDLYDKGMYNSFTGKRGNKAFRNNNPGNITGMSGNLLYGAAAIAHSKHGDKGDQKQLVFATPADGWRAMHSLMKNKYSGGPIKNVFSKWQTDQEAWGRMKNDLVKSGIDINKSFSSLSPAQQKLLMIKRARHEGWTGAIPDF